jgi:hypothetical protein
VFRVFGVLTRVGTVVAKFGGTMSYFVILFFIVVGFIMFVFAFGACGSTVIGGDGDDDF